MLRNKVSGHAKNPKGFFSENPQEVIIMAYKITQEREKCIGCGACVATCPENWKMDNDGKASPKKKAIEKKDFECNKEAESVCPVQIIHISEKKK